MDCELCGQEIPSGEGAVVKIDWVGTWGLDKSRKECRGFAQTNAVLCANCGRRVVDRLRGLVPMKRGEEPRHIKLTA